MGINRDVLETIFGQELDITFISIMFKKCIHEWELVSETTTKSKFEHSVEVSRKNLSESIKLPWQLCDGDRKLIQVLTCKKCGRLHRYVEDI